MYDIQMNTVFIENSHLDFMSKPNVWRFRLERWYCHIVYNILGLNIFHEKYFIIQGFLFEYSLQLQPFYFP